MRHTSSCKHSLGVRYGNLLLDIRKSVFFATLEHLGHSNVPNVPANVPNVPANVPNVPANVPNVPANVPNVPATLPNVPSVVQDSVK